MISYLRVLLLNSKKGRFYFFLLLFFILIEVSILILSMQFQKLIIDHILNDNLNHSIAILLLLGIFYVFHAILSVINPWLQSKTSSLIKSSVIEKYFKNFCDDNEISMDFTSKHSGEYIHFLNDEVTLVVNWVSGDIPDFFKSIVTALMISIFVLSINIYLFIFIFFFAVYSAFLNKSFSAKRKKIFSTVFKEKKKLNVFLKDSIYSLKEIIIMNNKEWVNKKFQNYYKDYMRISFKEGSIIAKQIGIQESISLIMIFIIVMFGGYLAFENKITIGGIVILYQLILELNESYQNTFKYFLQLKSKLGIVENAAKIYSKLEVKNSQEFEDLKNKESFSIKSIEFNNIVYSYENQTHKVIEGITFNIKSGKNLYYLIGRSGSGKTTLINLMCKFIQPKHGQIFLNEIDLQTISQKLIIKKISVVFQHPIIYTATIKDNILMGENADVKDDSIIEVLKAVDFYEDIVNMSEGINTIIKSRGSNLSGGQKQKIAIARALIRNTDVLILDEATSAIDFTSERHIINQIRNLRLNKITILITHRIEDISHQDKKIILN